jgi:two-component system, NarL family, sensor histidine kinase ComP
MYESQQFFETVLNHTSDMLFIVNQNRHIIYATPNFFEMTGYSLEELRGVDAFIIVHPEDKEYMMKRHHHLLESKQSNTTEYRMIKKNGEVRYFECNTAPLPDTKEYLQVVTTRDITERKQMELELQYHKNRHEVLQKSLKDFSQDLSNVMKIADLEERILLELVEILPDSNPTILKVNPRVESDLQIGKMVANTDKVLIKIGEREDRPYILSINKRALRENMESIWLETLAQYSIMVFANLLMIENLIHQLETASQSEESPRWLLRMMFNLQEQQRLTLSSDLHDTVLQDQIDLYRRLESLVNQYKIDNEAKIKLIEIEQGLLDIIYEIRATCNNLRPPLLRELGLKVALDNLFEHTQVTSTYKIFFTTGDLSKVILTEEQTIGIYRLVQELLHYAEEVSKANILEIDLYDENHRLKVVYRDDGAVTNGTEDGTQTSNDRLTSVNQRAQSLGGKMKMDPQAGNGLTVHLEFPINLERSFVKW